MITDLLLPTNLPNSDQWLEIMFQAFDDFMLILDEKGKILDYKSGGNSYLGISKKELIALKFQDAVPLEVRKRYENALVELKNGSKVVLFEYVIPTLKGDEWYESRLVPFLDDLKIMFVRNITKYKQLSRVELNMVYDKTVEGWARALVLRDEKAEAHTQHVTEITVKLARQLGVLSSELVHIQRGAILHDIGKVAIPDDILFKPGPLTEEEWLVMRNHPLIAVELLTPISYLAPALSIPRSHHEKWDGTGYPDGLAGENIPLPARIFAFADVYDALTSDRPYRNAWSRQDALDYVNKNSGIHFDPQITPEFVGMMAS